MSEQYVNLANSLLAGSIDGSTNPITFSVNSGDGALFPSTANGSFRVTVCDTNGGNAEVMVCTTRSTDSFTCNRGTSATSEVPTPTLVAHVGGSIVSHDITSGAMTQIRSEINQTGTFAGLPGTGHPGDRFVASDSVFDEYLWNGAGWDPYVAGIKCTPPGTATFPTLKKSTNATEDTFAVQNQALVLAGHVSSGDNLILQLATYPTGTFTKIFRFNCMFYTPTFDTFGIGVFDNVSGKGINWGFSNRGQNVPGFVAYSWNTVASGAASFYSGGGLNGATEVCGWGPCRGGLFHIKFSDDTTNRKVSISVDGLNWLQIQSVLRTDFITPTHLGISLMPYTTTTNGEFISVYDYT